MAERNAEVPKEKRIEFRIGINLGDVIRDGRDIFGDGVNVAARLEALAEPGGICVSRVVHNQVRDKLDLPFEDMGEQQVKNIARPVHVWRISLGTKSAVSASAPLALPDKPSIARGGETDPSQARGRIACLGTRHRPHARAMTGSPLKRARKQGVRLADGSIIAFPYMPRVADLPPGWRHFTTAEKIEHLIGLDRCEEILSWGPITELDAIRLSFPDAG